MEKHKDARTVKKVTLSVIIFAFVASSITLWLLESPLKHMLYLFEVALILTLYPLYLETFRKQRLKLKELSL